MLVREADISVLSNPQLSFTYGGVFGATALGTQIDVSTDGGSLWTNIFFSNLITSESATQHVIDLTPYQDTDTQIRILARNDTVASFAYYDALRAG